MNRHAPYYNMSDCCDQYRVNGSTGLPFEMPTGMPTGPAGPIPGMQPGMQHGMQQGMQPGTQQGATFPQGFMQQGFMQQQPSQNISQFAPIPPTGQPQALTLESIEYLNGFLRTQIGKKVRVEFLIGTGTLVDKSGTLLGVGANYIVINQSETDDIIVCDFFSIKFITFYY